MSIKMLGAIALALATTAAADAASPLTAFTLANATYTQNFDTLANGTGTSQALPAGFQIAEMGTGAAADDRYAIGTGSSNAGGLYSFGSAGSTDRALGSLGSGTVSPNYFGGIFTNGLGTAITSLAIAYTGEQWRFASGLADSLSFQYLVGATAIDTGTWMSFSALDFIAPQTKATTEGALNGNLAANRIALAGTISGLSVAAGQSFGFRWVDLNSDGNDQGLGVDDLTLTAGTRAAAVVPEPASWAMFIGGFALIGAAMRRRSLQVSLP